MGDDVRVRELMREGHPEASARLIARLVSERDAAVKEKKAAIKLAERTVLAAIDALGSNWWNRTADVETIRGELAQRRWYTEANGIDTRGLSPAARLHVQTLIGWVKTAGSPMP